MDADDHTLMLAVREGETAKLGELFERHHKALYGFFVRLTGQANASEDLVQMVFFRILKYKHTYRDEGKFNTWMYHLARKVAADFFRKHSRTPRPLEEPEDLHQVVDESPHAAALAEKTDEIALLRRALARLTLEQREIITLYRLQHLPIEDLARLKGCTVGTAKVRVHRALGALKDCFHELQGALTPRTSTSIL